MLTLGAAALGALVVGLGSALVPIVNAEAYAVLAGLREGSRPALVAVLATVLGLALGQTLGKLVLLETGRRARVPAGVSRLVARRHRSTASGRDRRERLERLLRRPRTGVPLVACSASLGLPPLAIVSLAAGVAGQPRLVFGVTCFAGRMARFGVIALPLALR